MGIQKPTKAEEKYIQEQKDRAQRLFWILLGVFAVSLFFLLLFQFKWWFLAGLTDAELKTFDSLKWALAALIGSGVYLIGQIGTYYQKIDNTPEEENQDDFIKQTYWYYSTLLKAPIMAVVIIWL